MRIAMIAIGALALVLVAGALLIDEGEVVVLVTTDSFEEFETPLWIVEVEGQRFLRASAPDAGWLERLRSEPRVRVRFGEGESAEVRRFRAIPVDDAEKRRRVNRAMASKYGFADRLWSQIGDRRRAVPIRLDSLSESELAGPGPEAVEAPGAAAARPREAAARSDALSSASRSRGAPQ